MKRLFQRVTMIIAGLLMIATSAPAGNPVGVGQLPEAALLTIGKSFKGRQVASSTMSSDLLADTYNVVFTNGDDIEFDDDGNWVGIHCTHSKVPRELVPQDIREYIMDHYGNVAVMEIDRSDDMYDLKLSNGEEIMFSTDFINGDINLW